MQLNVKDVTRLLGVSEKTVYRWINARRLPGYRVSGQYRFNRAELLEWATAQKVHVSPSIFQETEAETSRLPSLGEALREGGIFYRVEGADKTSALRAVVDLLRLPEEVDRNFLFEMLLAREKLASTGIGRGIAVPHTRNPLVLHVPRPMVTLCFLEKPVPFGALDGEPVFALFTVVSPTVKAHLHLLSRIAFALHDTRLNNLLKKQGTRDAILARLTDLRHDMHEEKTKGGKKWGTP